MHSRHPLRSSFIVVLLMGSIAVSVRAHVSHARPASAAAQTAAATPPATSPTQTQTPAASAPKASPQKNFAPLINAVGQSWVEKYINVPVIGQVNAYVPKQPSHQIVLFLSGDGGWELGVLDMSRRIAPKATVVGLNYVTLRKGTGDAECWMTSRMLDEIAHAAETELNMPDYVPPILVGYSSGATMVYGAMAQGPAGMFAGGVSLGFCPDLPSNKPACEVGDWKPTFEEKKSTAWLPTTNDIKEEWYVLHGVQDETCPPAETEKFLEGMAHAHYVPIEGTGHGFGKPQHWGPPFDDAIDALLGRPRGGASK